MNDIVTANWPLFVIGALVVALLLWWLLMASRRTRVSVDRRDTLDEGAAPAVRNQALIDAAPASGIAVPPVIRDHEPVMASFAAEKPAEGSDDLTRIKGLGPKLAATLGTLGVTSFEQIAAWSDADIDRIDSQLGRFAGRIRRDAWVEQARLLAAGDAAGFEAKFGAV